MHGTIGLMCYIGPLTLTLVRSSVSLIVPCIIKCNCNYDYQTTLFRTLYTANQGFVRRES